MKELKKLKEKDTESLEVANKKLQQEVDQLKAALVLKEDEVKDFLLRHCASNLHSQPNGSKDEIRIEKKKKEKWRWVVPTMLVP